MWFASFLLHLGVIEYCRAMLGSLLLKFKYSFIVLMFFETVQNTSQNNLKVMIALTWAPMWLGKHVSYCQTSNIFSVFSLISFKDYNYLYIKPVEILLRSLKHIHFLIFFFICLILNSFYVYSSTKACHFLICH